MKTDTDLKTMIQRIDRHSYPAYKDLAGSYAFLHYTLHIDHVQGDPFAAPSKVSVSVDRETAGFPERFYQTKARKIAFEDALVRNFSKETKKVTFQARGSGKSGLIGCSTPGQEILERTACHVDDEGETRGNLRIRLEVGFPANGRTINGRELIRILFDFLPEIVEKTLMFHRSEENSFQRIMELADDQEAARQQLEEIGCVAFVADGAILPRESGVSQRPLKNAVSFSSPETMRVTLQLPHRGKVTGMGIPRGITLIVGGGFHGKSTLLEALQFGVYNHIEGDGRELVLTDATAVKLRAEDGRSVRQTDISLFIDNLPTGQDCRKFHTENASGSTSQAANTIEAIEAGCQTFLIDEDTCATNFMIRDALMAEVVHRDKEPITPFLSRVRALYEEGGVSTILVAGSSGAYFHMADHIIQMDGFRPLDITELAKTAANQYGSKEEMLSYVVPDFQRIPAPLRLSGSRGENGNTRYGRNVESRGGDRKQRVKTKTMGKDGFSINRETVDLRYLEQLADSEQTQALACCLKYLDQHILDGKRTLQQIADILIQDIQQKGLAVLSDSGRNIPAMAMPRKQEVLMMLNRYRSLVIKDNGHPQ